MKNYFDFTLTGKKLFPIWMLLLVTVLAPYVAIILNMRQIQPGDKPSPLIFLGLLGIVVVAFVVSFFLRKLVIENVSYNGQNIKFNGSFGTYLGKVLLGFFLTIITLGIYMAWFIKSLTSFFIDNCSYDSKPFKFNGKGGTLFLILLLTLMLPMILFMTIMVTLVLKRPELLSMVPIIQAIFFFFVLIPYFYLIYKWSINIEHNGYKLSWESSFWSACGKIALEIFLSIITLGIYFPLAYLRLYKFFTDKTIALNEIKRAEFGFDIDLLNDFLFMWGQILLTIVTLGIYYPWAYSKICKLFLSKTYISE